MKLAHAGMTTIVVASLPVVMRAFFAPYFHFLLAIACSHLINTVSADDSSFVSMIPDAHVAPSSLAPEKLSHMSIEFTLTTTSEYRYSENVLSDHSRNNKEPSDLLITLSIAHAYTHHAVVVAVVYVSSS